MDPLKRYKKYLKEFAGVCEDMIDSGMPYMAVILNHELFRYLYPEEPFTNFFHKDPVIFITRHLKKLTSLAKACLKSVKPYDMNFAKYNSLVKPDSLEETTSVLYADLWKRFDRKTLSGESVRLLSTRLPKRVIRDHIKGKTVLDLGCGSGRYTIALYKLGAKKVIGIDYRKESYRAAQEYAKKRNLQITFKEGDCVNLKFPSESFDFVFCNGVLHHTKSIENGILQIKKVLKKGSKAFLYLYADGGIFWDTRVAMRKIFKKIPRDYTQKVLELINLPPNRFIFCDSWYVPIETHMRRNHLEDMLDRLGFDFKKIASRNSYDLDSVQVRMVKGAKVMWGESGEHRYILSKSVD
ncbi:MAG: methyltransferase domain-containing protein [Candidatus Omnitrophica bacterium]|nr:methyltransferase domain-containing protein [Candidatus Omnitrophota bacterium]